MLAFVCDIEASLDFAPSTKFKCKIDLLAALGNSIALLSNVYGLLQADTDSKSLPFLLGVCIW